MLVPWVNGVHLMWNPLKAYFEHRERMAKIQQETAIAPYHALMTTVTAQNAVMREWLSGFKSTAIPTTSNVRELDEYNLELDRERLGRESEWEKIDVAFPTI